MRRVAKRFHVARWSFFAACAFVLFPRPTCPHRPTAVCLYGRRSASGIRGRAFFARHACCPPLCRRRPLSTPHTTITPSKRKGSIGGNSRARHAFTHLKRGLRAHAYACRRGSHVGCRKGCRPFAVFAALRAGGNRQSKERRRLRRLDLGGHSSRSRGFP